jgi:hypothetical protein
MHIQAYKAALTWFRWPDDGAPLTAAPKLTLPTAIQDDVDHYKNKAYAQTSKGTRDSAWAAWTQYCNDGQSIDPMAVLSDSDFDLLMAGFKARLARGYYGRGKAKASLSIDTYEAAVIFYRKPPAMSKQVGRGIRKEKGTFKKVKRTITLDIACDIAVQQRADSLRDLRNATCYAQMGQGFMRAQSVVNKTIEKWESGEVLMVSDVQIDTEKYCVHFGKKKDKPDHFGDRLDETGHDWVHVAGAKGTPLDIMPVIIKYVELMGFNQLNENQKRVTPFYQQILFNKPTGKPHTYSVLLGDFRSDLSKLPKSKYPLLKTHEWGLHAFRRFAATVAKLQGLPNDIIQTLGKWNSDSFLLYFTFTPDEELEYQSRIFNGNQRLHTIAEELGYGLPTSSTATVSNSQSSGGKFQAATGDHDDRTSAPSTDIRGGSINARGKDKRPKTPRAKVRASTSRDQLPQFPIQSSTRTSPSHKPQRNFKASRKQPQRPRRADNGDAHRRATRRPMDVVDVHGAIPPDPPMHGPARPRVRPANARC